jgi:hypothetical protein
VWQFWKISLFLIFFNFFVGIYLGVAILEDLVAERA